MDARKTTVTLSVITLLMFTGAYASDWVSFPGGTNEPEPPTLTVLESNEQQTVLRITIPGMLVDEIEVDEEVYDKLEIPEYLYTGEIGKAEIPALGEFIAIPGMKDFSVDITKADSFTLEDYYVYPVQEPYIYEEPPFAKDETFYQTDEFYPAESVELGGASIWRDLRVINPAIFPIRYNPVTSELEVTYSITLRFSYFGTSNDNVKEDPDYPIEERYAQSYRTNIVNYEFLGLYEVYWAMDTYDYLILYDAYLESWEDWFLNESGLVDHLMSRGYSVKTVGVDYSATAEQIKDIIRDYYNNYSIDYVLLVGNPGTHIPRKLLQPRHYETGEYLSEYYYELLSGDDIIPEISIGRIPWSNPEQGQNAIDKIIAYENGAAPGPWPKDNLLVAHKEDRGYDSDDFEYTKDQIKDYEYITYEPNFYTAYGGEGADNDDVKGYINTGCGTVNYAGHGNTVSWSEWNDLQSWTVTDINNLNNGIKTPVVFNMCCHTGSDLNLAADWIINNPNKGAVGSVGFTTSEWILMTNYMDRYLYEALYYRDVLEFGNSFDHARCDLIKRSSSWVFWLFRPFADMAVDNILMSVLLGDPSMPIRTGALFDFTSVEYGHSAIIGYNHKEVIVAGPEAAPVKDAIVCLYQPGGIHYAKGTDNTGNSAFDFELSSTEDIQVTVWKRGYVTYSGVITVEQ
jgi:hypothetical protein